MFQSHSSAQGRARHILQGLLAIGLLFAGSSALWADRVYLRNGTQIDGVIINQNKNEVTFRSGSGQEQKIQKSDIARIVYGNMTPEQKASEEKQKQDEAARLAAYQKQLAEAKRLETEKQEAERRRAEQLREEEARKAQAVRDREQTKQNENKPAQSQPSAAGCAWRSALLPGWGQYACGQTRSAIEVGALFLGAGAYAAQQNALQRNALRSYNRTSLYGYLAFAQQGNLQTTIQYELTKQSKGEYRSRLRNYGQAVSIVGFIYVAQIAHAFWIGRPVSPVASAPPGYSMESTSITIQPDWRASSSLLPSSGNRMDLTFTRRF